MVDRLAVLELLSSTEDVVLGGAEAESLFTLSLRAGEDDDVAAHGRGELDGQVTQTSDTHNTDTIGRANTIFRQNSPDSGTSTHQRCSIRRVVSIRNGNDTASIPDNTMSKGTEVVVVGTILLLVLTVLVPAYRLSVSMCPSCLTAFPIRGLPDRHFSQVPQT